MNLRQYHLLYYSMVYSPARTQGDGRTVRALQRRGLVKDVVYSKTGRGLLFKPSATGRRLVKQLDSLPPQAFSALIPR